MGGATTRGDNMKNKKNENPKEELNKLADDYVAPDGGWGWIIVLAAGFSNLCVLVTIQNFGLIFRVKLAELGITPTETTTILNVHLAVTAMIGLANGPVFKRFSFRQMALFGTILSAFAVMVLSTATTFHEILIYLAVFQAAGGGITMSSNALALNTYFKKRKRLAVGLSWTCTGFGPIIMPHVITALMPIFDVSGTLLILGGFSAHSIACSLLLHPVAWHAKKISVMDELRAEAIKEKHDIMLNNGVRKDLKALSVENLKEKLSTIADDRQGFGSQYLYYDDEEEGAVGIDVEGGTPMMSRANDGWFSKKNSSTVSLTSNRTVKHENSQVRLRNKSFSLSRPPSITALSQGQSLRNINKGLSENDGKRRKLSNQISGTTPLIIVRESCESTNSNEDNCKVDECPKYQEDTTETGEETVEEPPASRFKRFIHAIVIFFDLDLLRDKVYVNLMLGLNFANFTEINFALITPFILGDYGLEINQVAMFMSVLGGVDVVARIFISFLATKIGFSNRTFFLIGVTFMSSGRIILAHTIDYTIILLVAVLIGFGKSLRTIFIALVIPTHVPLSRLPAATGLQLVTSGLISIGFGPLVGKLRIFLGNYSILLHILNIFPYLVIISWTLEAWITSRRTKKNKDQPSTQA
ncbi:uncharacterized protein [Fopius arisanus]|uniref:Uncharacterized protein isoform X2 n=2 Tax=Fopius arisanus TaxID=64838 RepID=A0A9R1UAV3_9HYME|nr:PREDICTED: uncharacterized protein LOC105273253 isoform X2 [Fopius arisanus]